MFKNRAGLRNRILSLAVAGALGVAGTAIAAVPVGGQFRVLTQATQLSRGDTVRNTVPLNKPIRISVALKLRNDAQVKNFLANVATPGAPRVMSQAQLQNHLPTQAQAQAVADYLKHAGFGNVTISSNRMIVHATGSAAAVQSAFQTSLVSVRTHDDRNAFANNSPIKIPAALHDIVQAVLGLQTVHKAHTLARPMAGGTVGVIGHSPLDFPHIYDASSLPAANRVDVAIVGWGSMASTLDDLKAFTNANGLKKVKTMVVCTDTNGIDFNTGAGLGGTTIGDPTCNGNFDQGSLEWDLDSQDIIGMTGGVKSMTFYAAYGAYNTTITDAINEAVTPTVGEPRAQVVNQSFGECERFEDINQGGDGSAQADDALYQLGALQGQTFTASTGDSGANNCSFGNPLDSASYPASSPWVVAVSGTTLRASHTTWARENVWIDSGGSPSSFEKAQSWQAPLTYGPFAGQRGPDVAFDANPNSGAIINYAGGLAQVGGTSLAAPLFAGAWARILQGNEALGFAAPHLYALPKRDLHDIRSGNNGYYIARPGWDWASGLGSFEVAPAARALGASK
ncbi:MAG: S53 family peptidase [Rhodanobacteraceae bacterium]